MGTKHDTTTEPHHDAKLPVSCWAVLLEFTTGCEADATSTIVKAVFTEKQKALDYCKELTPKINWNNYYMGTLEVEEVPFEPCS